MDLTNSKKLRFEIFSWLILIAMIAVMLYYVPKFVGYFFKSTFEEPYKAQQIAIQRSNKTEDTASGIKGTSINNIPYTDFEKVFESLKSQSPNQFKSVDIKIPKIYVTSPIFNYAKYDDKLQDIWMDSINETQLREQYGAFKIFYNKNLINDNGKQYSSDNANYEELEDMKDIILIELNTNDKFKDVKFKKWYVSEAGTEDVKASGTNGIYNFEATMETKDLKPDFMFGSSKKVVHAEFEVAPKIELIKNSLEIK